MIKEEKLKLMKSVPYWWHHIDLGDGILTPGHQGFSGFTQTKLEMLPIPMDLKDKTVLDIGCSDGYFSFACEKRGAKVLSVDNTKVNPSKGFFVARKILNSKVDCLDSDIYNLDVNKIGQFDVVLALGLLYHLPSPFLAIRKLKELAKEFIIIQTRIDLSEEAVMRFIPNPYLKHGHGHSMWHPSKEALRLMLEDCNLNYEFLNIGSKTDAVIKIRV